MKRHFLLVLVTYSWAVVQLERNVSIILQAITANGQNHGCLHVQ